MRKSFTKNEDEKISKMLIENFSNPEIAAALGRSTYSIHNRIYKLRNNKLTGRNPLPTPDKEKSE